MVIDIDAKENRQKLLCLYRNIKEINKKLSNGIISQLEEYRSMCDRTSQIFGELDASIKHERHDK